MDIPEKDAALESFYQKWSQDDLVLDKWFMVQARSESPNTLLKVKELTKHPAFSIKNPNKVRALLKTFSSANPAVFHADPEITYNFYTDQILTLDKLNPQVAASLLTPYLNWQRWCEPQSHLQKQQLEKIVAQKGLSRNVYEIIMKCLEQNANG